MGESTPGTVELTCPGCSANFRLKPKKGKLPQGPIPCPKCGTRIPVEIGEAKRGGAPRGADSSGERTPPSAQILGKPPRSGVISRKIRRPEPAPDEPEDPGQAPTPSPTADPSQPRGEQETAEQEAASSDRHRSAIEQLVDEDKGPNSTFLGFGFPESGGGGRTIKDKTAAIDENTLRQVRARAEREPEENHEALVEPDPTEKEGSTTDTSHFMRKEDQKEASEPSNPTDDPAEQDRRRTRELSPVEGERERIAQAEEEDGQAPFSRETPFHLDKFAEADAHEPGPFDLRDILDAEKDQLPESVSNEITRNPALEKDDGYPVQVEQDEAPRPLPDDSMSPASPSPPPSEAEAAAEASSPTRTSEPEEDEAPKEDEAPEEDERSMKSNAILGRLKSKLRAKKREESSPAPRTGEVPEPAPEDDEDDEDDEAALSGQDIFSEASQAEHEADPAPRSGGDEIKPALAARLKRKLGSNKLDSIKERIESEAIDDAEASQREADADEELGDELSDDLAEILSSADEDDLARVMDEASERSPHSAVFKRADLGVDAKTSPPQEGPTVPQRKVPEALLAAASRAEDEEEEPSEADAESSPSQPPPTPSSAEPSSEAGQREPSRPELNTTPMQAPDLDRERKRSKPSADADALRSLRPPMSTSRRQRLEREGVGDEPSGARGVAWGDAEPESGQPPRADANKGPRRRRRQDSHSGLFPISRGLGQESSVTGMASDRRGSGYIRLPTTEILEVLGRGHYRLMVEDIVYEPVDEQGLTELIKRGVLMGAEMIAEPGAEWSPIGEHPVFRRLRKKMAVEAHALLAKYQRDRKEKESSEAEAEAEAASSAPPLPSLGSVASETDEDQGAAAEAAPEPAPSSTDPKPRTLPMSALSAPAHNRASQPEIELEAPSAEQKRDADGPIDPSSEFEVVEDEDERAASAPPLPSSGEADAPEADAPEADAPEADAPEAPEPELTPDEGAPEERARAGALDPKEEPDQSAPEPASSQEPAGEADEPEEEPIEPEPHAALGEHAEPLEPGTEEPEEPIEDPFTAPDTGGRGPLMWVAGGLVVLALVGAAALAISPELRGALLGAADSDEVTPGEPGGAGGDAGARGGDGEPEEGPAGALTRAKRSVHEALGALALETPEQRHALAGRLLEQGDAEAAATIYEIDWTPRAPAPWTKSLAEALAEAERWSALRRVARAGMAHDELAESMRTLHRKATASDPRLRGMEPRMIEDRTQDRKLRPLRVGKLTAFALEGVDGGGDATQPEWVLVPQQRRLSESAWKKDVIAWRLCELIVCHFQIPESAPARISEADFNALVSRGQGSGATEPSRRYGGLEWARREGPDGAERRYLDGVIKRWQPAGAPWPMEAVNTWRPWVTAYEDAAVLEEPLDEALSGIKREYPKVYASVLEQRDGLTTRDLARQISSLIVFDYLINNMNRFRDRPTLNGTPDNQLRKGRLISLEHRTAFASRISNRVEGRFGWVTRFSRETIESVRGLEREQADAILFPEGNGLDASERTAFWERHGEMLKTIYGGGNVQGLIERYGEDEVMAFE